jgi:hypothetical protein
MAEDPLCLFVISTDANDLGTRDCSSAKRNLSSRSTFGRFEFALKLHDRGASLQSLTWQSTSRL